MKTQTVRLACLAAITTLAPSTALANQFFADCDGWRQTATSGTETYIKSMVTLEVLSGGVWVDTGISSMDSCWLPSATDFCPTGALWGVPLDSGTYRASLSRSEWYGDWSDKDAAAAFAAGTAPNLVLDFWAPIVFECINFIEPRTPGFWKNHPEDWGTDSLPLGNEGSSFSQECLLQLLSVPTRGDIRIKLSHHLIAAKLNLLNASDPNVITGFPDANSTVGDTIAASDAYLLSVDVGCDGLGGSKPSGAEKQYVVALKSALDVYNNGVSD